MNPGNISGNPAGCSYTIQHRDNCVLIFGSVPASSLTAITGLAPDGALMAMDLARMVGANFAFGLKADVDALVEKLKPAAVASTIEKYAGQNLPTGAAEWLAAGERGVSSNTMFEALTGVSAFHAADNHRSHPHDPADLRRCVLLLEAVPELRQRLTNLRHVSAEWSMLVDIWGVLTDTLAEEMAAGKSAPRTYALMKEAINKARTI